MGFRDWFKPGGGGGAAAAPSAEHPTPLSAILALIELEWANTDDGQWVTWEGRGNGRAATIELAGEELNFCTWEVDLRALLGQMGLGEVAATAQAGGERGDDRTIWRVRVEPAVLASIIDMVFIDVMGLGEGYSVRGERHG